MTDIVTCTSCCWTGDRDDLVAEATAPDAFNHCPRCSCVTFEVDDGSGNDADVKVDTVSRSSGEG